MKRLFMGLAIILLLLGVVLLFVNRRLPTAPDGRRSGPDALVSGHPTEPALPPGSRAPGGVPLPPVASTTAEGETLPILVGAQVSPHVTAIIGQDSTQRRYLERAGALKALSRRINANDQRALLAFLDTRYADQKGLSVLEFNSLKNDVLDVLIKQDVLPEGLGLYMVAMYRDDRHDDTWRDYCIQYMVPYHQRKWPPGAEAAIRDTDAHERTAITNALWEAARRPGSSTAGTALLGLQTLAGSDPGFEVQPLASLVVATASDENAVEGARITAFSLSTLFQRTEVLPAARRVAQTGETVVLQMAATRALGELGEAGDADLLRALVASPEKRLANIARTAMARLEERLKPAPGEKR